MPRNFLLLLMTVFALAFHPAPARAGEIVYYLRADTTEKAKAFLTTDVPVVGAAQTIVAFGVAQKRYVKFGTWTAVSISEPLNFANVSDLRLWIGVKNRNATKDSSIIFDFRVELLKNDVPIASGEITNRNIVVGSAGLTEITIPFALPTDTHFSAGDDLGLRVFVKVSSDLPGGQKSLTWADSVTAYFGSVDRPSRFGLTTPVASSFAITSLPNLSTVTSNRITIGGTVNIPNATVQVNGVAAPVNNGVFSASVLLHEGNNFITAVATDDQGRVSTTSIQVTLDTAPPIVTIDTPRDGAVLSEPQVTVTGLINDIVAGTVSAEQARVTVNGIPAGVANRTYVVTSVPLVPGTNTLTAFGTDRAGNTNSYSINVFYNISAANRIKIVSGDHQVGQIGQLLPLPLIVQATDTNGNPCANKKVIFKVIQNDGLVGSGAAIARSLIVTSDVSGLASVQFTLGTRAGAGNNQVSAKIVGFEGEAMFCSSSSNSAPGLLVLDTGNNQVGAVSRPLPRPLGVVVVDAGNNRLRNVPVTFTVTAGGGSFDGQTSLTVNSDTDGRAFAVMTLGPDAGNDNNQVQATFSGNNGLPVTFVASAQIPGDPDETSVSGVVLDNSDIPVPGARIFIAGRTGFARSDANGYFQIKPAPVGAIRLVVRGEFVTRPGSWVWLQFDMVTIAGQDNTLGRPVRLLARDEAQGLNVDETHGGTLTLRQVPGFSLKIAPNSVTFPDNTHAGLISVTVVHPDKMPDPPEFGQQPRFLVTIQPANALFNPPAAICIPNLDGLRPGQKTEMYSYDHDMGQFVAIGTGTCSEDGSQICSDPGVGVVKAGWHCGGNPASVAAGIVSSVSTDKADLVLCTDEEGSVIATGSPTPAHDPTSFEWQDGGLNVTPETISGNTSKATIKSSTKGDFVLKVRYRCKSAQWSAYKEIKVKVVELKEALAKRVDESDTVYDNDPGQFCLNDKISGRVTIDPAGPVASGSSIRWVIREKGFFSSSVFDKGDGVQFSGSSLTKEGSFDVVFYCDSNGNGEFDDGFLGFGAEPHASTESFNVKKVTVSALVVKRHIDISYSDATVDSHFALGNARLHKKDRILTTGGDFRCCLDLQRSGSVGTFGIAGDGLDVITSDAELNQVFAMVGNIKVVTSMAVGVCNSGGGTPLGCGYSGGSLIITPTASSSAWLHEWGHVKGLGHRDTDTQNVMYFQDTGGDTVNEDECEAYEN